jgi:hypothetical protein
MALGLFNRARMKKAEDLAVQIGENLLGQSLLDPARSNRGPRELVQELVLRVCQVNPAWALEGASLVRRGRRGRVSVPVLDLATPLDLLGNVIDGDLREHGRLNQRDHDEVLLRALRRLSTTIEQRALSEVKEALADEIESRALWEELASAGDDPEEFSAARANLTQLAQELLRAGHGALALANFLDESRLRPLTALRFYASRNPNWSIHRGELLYRGAGVGHYGNDDPLNSIYADMVWAVLEQDYSGLSEATVRELTLSAMRYWDCELAGLYLRAGEEAEARPRA